MPSQHGIHTWLDDAVMDTWPAGWSALAEFKTLPERLEEVGYHTSLIGKYHLGIADAPQNGFDNWITLQAGHVLSFHDNEIIDNGRRFVCRGHCVDFFTERAVDTIRERAERRREPFFLFLTYPAPYGFWPAIEGEPAERYRDRYRDTRFHSVPREAVSKQLVDWVLIRHDKLPDAEPDYFESLVRMPNDLPTLRNYYSQMSVVDEGAGKVLAALEAHGLSDDTLIIYTSDHGMAIGEHGFWGHGEDSWSYGFGDELYDLVEDPDERNNVAASPENRAVIRELSLRLDNQFAACCDPKWDLWNGGSVKSNSTRPFLWQEVWGAHWSPTC